MNRPIFKHFIFSIIFLALLSGGRALAAGDFYALTSETNSDSGTDSEAAQIHLNVTAGIDFQTGDFFKILLPTGGSEIGIAMSTGLEGSISQAKSANRSSMTVFALQNNRGSLEVTQKDGQISSLLLFDSQEKKFFKAEISDIGTGVFKEELSDKYQWSPLPLAPPDSAFTLPSNVEELTPDLNTLKNLESKPGASNTVYINNWGGKLTGTAWNANNSGNVIAYTPYSNDSDTTAFSTTERYLMWLAWKETAEDYSTFDVNITTSQSVYDATASGNRSQIIATNTNSFYPDAGGVAYVGIFGRTDDYYNTGFTWNSGSSSMGMTHSHEAGHQMGLGHSNESLYHLSVEASGGVPGKASLHSPRTGTTVFDATPTYVWHAVSNTTHYQLVVNDSAGGKIRKWYSAAASGCSSGSGTCSITPATPLAAGTARWWIRTYSAAGYGPFSTRGIFTVNNSVPGKATLLSPKGIVVGSIPTFTWHGVAGSTHYQLIVSDSTGVKIRKWYSATAADCNYGCAITSTTPLADGAAKWWIRTFNAAGYGPFSTPETFTVDSSVPGVATPISPTGTIADSTPTYTWNAVSAATHYRLTVHDSTGRKINKWYTATATGCSSGSGICSLTPTTALANGMAKWWLGTYSPTGYGPYSARQAFTVSD